MQKVEGSNPFIRSSLIRAVVLPGASGPLSLLSRRRGRVAEARVCKTRYTGSIPVGASPRLPAKRQSSHRSKYAVAEGPQTIWRPTGVQLASTLSGIIQCDRHPHQLAAQWDNAYELKGVLTCVLEAV